MPEFGVSLIWFRRDLRLDDHAALYHALKSSRAVCPVFVFDTDILDFLTSPDDRRVEFIHESIASLKAELEAMGSTLQVLHGSARQLIPIFPASWCTGRVLQPGLRTLCGQTRSGSGTFAWFE